MATAAALCLLVVFAASAHAQGQGQGQFWNRWDGAPWWLNDATPQVQVRPRPTTTTTTTTTTTPSPVDSFGRVPGCDCPAPPQYNPVCGSDGNTYNNPQLVECANRCGHRVTISFIGLCVAGKK